MTSENLWSAIGQIEEKYVAEAGAVLERQGRGSKRHRFLVKCAAAAAALAICFMGFYQSGWLAQAAEAFMSWFEDHVTYHFKEQSEISNVPCYTLSYLPEGFRWYSDEYYGEMGAVTAYSSERQEKFTFIYGLSGGQLEVPNGERDYKVLYTKDGTELHYFQAGQEELESSLTWFSEDENLLFSIVGRLSQEELLQIQQGVAQAETPAGQGLAGFGELIASLAETERYALWQNKEGEELLLVTDMTYQIDETDNAALYCDIYGIREGRTRYLGTVYSTGTAYPISWDETGIYAAGGHFVEKYVPGEIDSLILADGVRYIFNEECYRMLQDAAVEENFTENGDSIYTAKGESLSEEEGEAALMALFEEYNNAEVIDFRKRT